MREAHQHPDDANCVGDSVRDKHIRALTAALTLRRLPLAIACFILFFLHRRSKKRQALEDANDPHKSLDFGVDMPSQPAKAKKKGFGKGVPEMTVTEVPMDGSGRKARGLSMDMHMNSPYLLPAQLQGSRESLHSMSRTVQDQHDPYRPVNLIRSSHETTRSPRPFTENGSVYSASTVRTADNSSLLANAQRMSQSLAYPKRGDSKASEETARQMHSARSTTPSRKSSQSPSEQTLSNISENGAARQQTLPTLPSPPQVPSPEPTQQMPPPRKSSMPSSAMPPRKSSMSAATQSRLDKHTSETSYYGEDIPPPPPPPKIEEPAPMMGAPVVQEPDAYDSQYDIDPAVIYTGRFSIDNSAPSQQHYPAPNNRVSVMGLRPLPPDDPQENAEQRANRIRSFYKEYFDDSRPGPAQGGYYEDSDYYTNGAIYDPGTGTHLTPVQAPFAQPMGRRAMTPPPRAGPRFAGADMHRRQYSTMSAGRAAPRGRAPAPVKKLPPPKALTSLPTPHLLREDTALIMNPIDFAPPTTFREHQNGRRPDSPMGIQRPYSPSVKAYSPLVPAFDELSAMPSPHHLRKSGAFMPLDFAPPSRLKIPGEGNGSDSGSIRSARSGISAVQMDAVRAGAYRVSRIPKEFVTSRDDLSNQLRPKMDLISRA